MAFSIRNARVEQKARAYAAETGETLTGALERALDTAMTPDGTAAREAGREAKRAVIREIQDRIAALPVLDPRPYREILYDEDGLPR